MRYERRVVSYGYQDHEDNFTLIAIGAWDSIRSEAFLGGRIVLSLGVN